ncbi:hypothetical protein ONS95_013674 [Cadophora gregata]|uniref:uncharacterized protein n=1 Tax=Cadophora gregata TaxID=51156 RepID=UPI0026DAADE4|nr:uncharacterized protein ONS95_013674 [Cadophora gregata]KAK0113417.1 hypothetical protein ONS96_014283 [Cadophora gregata f. sp. sojae]KAK0114174.1 hypothetical protein ONS95_013674 [Cadophora gregata]
MERVLFITLGFVFIGCPQVLGLIAPKPPGAVMRTFANSSFTSASSSPTPTACCFLVQDTVSEVWWQITSYSSTLTTVNLTSITTLITKFPNTTLTNFETNIYPTGVSATWTYRVGANPIANEPNYVLRPTEAEQILEGTAPITTGGIVVQSPDAFYVYSSVKIITAAPVTDAGGNIACGTTSEYNEWNADQFFSYRTLALSDINSNAEAYFDRSDVAEPLTLSVLSSFGTEIFITGSQSDQISSIYVDADSSETCCPDGSGTMITATTRTEVVISLETPFIYLPSKGRRGFRGDTTTCHQTGGTENYGYVPRTLLEYLVNKSDYSSQYPGLESCLPGGPSIFQSAFCADAMSSTLEVVSDLTSTTVIYVTPPVLGDTTQLHISDVQVMVHASGIEVDGDFSTTQLPTPPPRPMPSPVKTEPSKNPPQPLPLIVRPTPLPTSIGAPVPTTNPVGPSLLPASKHLPGPLPAFTSLRQIINSIIGGRPGSPASPASPNSPAIIISAATTIPIADIPFFPGISGVTSTINGNPVVIVSEPTTLASPVRTKNQIVISKATTIPIADLPFFPGLVGNTETRNGAIVVIVSEPTTLALPSPEGLSRPHTSAANPILAAPEVHDEPLAVVTAESESPGLFVTRPTTVPFNPESPVSGSTITTSGKIYIVVSTAVAVGSSQPILIVGPSSAITDSGIKNTQGAAASETSSRNDAAPELKGRLWRYLIVESCLLVGFLAMVIK